MTALEKLATWRDPEYPDGIPALEEPVEEVVPAAAPTGDTEWVSWSGTYYPTLGSVPWQSRGSAVEVPARS